MNLIRTGHFQADGNAYNLVLGFQPDHIKLWNANAAAGEVACIEWFKDTGFEVQWKMLADNGSTASTTFNFVSSGMLITLYAGSSSASKGVTIAASWMDDDDEIYYRAELNDRDVDHGDVA